MLTLAELHPIVVFGLVALFVVVSAMLVLAVLIQRPQGGGLSEAFGSASGSGHTAFGAKTGDALTTATIGIFILFLLAAIGLNYVVKPPAAASAVPSLQAPGAPMGDLPPTTIPVGSRGNPIKLEQVPAPGSPAPAPTSGTTGATPDGAAGDDQAKPALNPTPPPAESPTSTPPQSAPTRPESPPQETPPRPPR